MTHLHRRDFLQTAALGLAGSAIGFQPPLSPAQEPGDRPKRAEGVTVINPRGRVPVGLIIDDSTCLVNLAHFCIPQFAEVFPDRFTQDWRSLPREIPDRFVRKFAEWCREHGVKGKYSVVPYPACVGWVDREMPGWTKRELTASLDLLRTDLAPDWDFHPEMVTHTWVIDTKTGRPYPERSDRFMENWRWTDGRSADEIGDYLAYALRVLKNAGLNCEGITTPGGFGNRALPALSLASLQACRDVFNAEIPHYFRHLFTGPESVAPRVENARHLDGPNPECVVSIIGCTGDWFGDWDGLHPGKADQCITEDGKGGRLPEVIARGEPAVIVCHWAGIYFNGEEVGFKIFQEVVKRLEVHYPDRLIWMKLSELSRYWAAKELTTIRLDGTALTLDAPFACPEFTLRVDSKASGPPSVTAGGKTTTLGEAKSLQSLVSGTWLRDGGVRLISFDLPKGRSVVNLGDNH